MATATKITPSRVAEARAAVEGLIEKGVYCNWTETMRTLSYFFEDLTADMKEAAHE